MVAIIGRSFSILVLYTLIALCSSIEYWTKGPEGKLVNIPYVITGFNNVQIQAVNDGMEAIENATCIRFFPRNGQPDYIRFKIAEDGLGSSPLGKRGGEQFVLLNYFGSTHQHRVIHELFHTLGFHHTHQRFDRDEFVQILTQNIKAANEHAFTKYTADKKDIQGTVYDFESIMHYDSTAFSKNDEPTIVPRNKYAEYTGKFGNKLEMSAGDILRVNRLYDCPGFVTWN